MALIVDGTSFDKTVKVGKAAVKPKSSGMEKVEIYRFQLENIDEALRLTSNLENCESGATCFDRMVRRAKRHAENALNGDIDIEVNYISGKNKEAK